MSLKSPSTVPGLARCTRVWRFALWAALGAAAPGLASGGVAGVLTTTVTTLAERVTYASVSKSGEPLVTYVGYNFKTTYTGTNTTNNVRLEGEIESTKTAELVTLDTASSPSFCRAEPLTDKKVKLICDIGQVRASTRDIEFQVFFKAPQNAGGAGGTLTLTGSTLYAEISDGADNTNNSSPWTGQAPVGLGTVNVEDIKSVLPKSGGKLFSGNGGIPNGADRFTTTVLVPDATGVYAYTTTSIEEERVPDCLNTMLADGVCFTLDLAIKGLAIEDKNFATANFFPTGEPLTIILTLDKEAVPPKVKPSQLIIEYKADDLSVPKPVGLCETGGPVQGGEPCLSEPPFRIRDRKNADRDGDVVIPVQNYQNGSFRVF